MPAAIRVLLHLLQGICLLVAAVGGVLLGLSWLTDSETVPTTDVDETITAVIISGILSVGFSPILWSVRRRSVEAAPTPAAQPYGAGLPPPPQPMAPPQYPLPQAAPQQPPAGYGTAPVAAPEQPAPPTQPVDLTPGQHRGGQVSPTAPPAGSPPRWPPPPP